MQYLSAGEIVPLQGIIVVELLDVCFRYQADVDILRGISLSVAAEEFVAVLGPSGVGKTTLLRMVAGLLKPTSGQVLLNGTRVTNLAPVERRIGIVFQSLALFPHLSVFANIAFGLRQAGQSRKAVEQRVQSLMGLLHIAELKERRPAQLSGGQAQRVAIARALAPDAQILLLDEPFSNLDRHVADISCELIRSVHTACGLTTVLVTHDRNYALQLATRVVVIGSGGRLTDDGPPDQVYRRPKTLESARVTGPLVEFPGCLRETDGTLAQIEIAGMKLTAAIGQRCSPCSSPTITATARPDSFHLANGHADNSFVCHVVGCRIPDRPYDLRAVLADGTAFTVSLPPRAGTFKIGEEIRLRIAPSDLMCYPREEEL